MAVVDVSSILKPRAVKINTTPLYGQTLRVQDLSSSWYLIESLVFLQERIQSFTGIYLFCVVEIRPPAPVSNSS